MCGIGLAITKNSEDHNLIANKINNDQFYRGPDFSKIKNYLNYSICHQRLSIIDLNKRSNQPFEYKNIEIIFNGEIFNFESLKKELIEIGHVFKTTSDTEVIAVGIYYQGKNFLKKLDGMFSICWIDKLEKKIYLTADPFGIKQIYYYKYKNIFIATSELFVLRDVIREMKYQISENESTLNYFTSYLSLPLYATPFNEIKSLCNGSLISINIESKESDIEYKFYESFIPKNYSNKISSSEDLTLDLVFDESFQADVKQAILLSGGIDSTNLAISSNKNKNNFSGYCINTNLSSDGYSDDLKYAKIVARNENIPLKIINYDRSINLGKVLDTLKRLKNIGEFSSALSLNYLFNLISADSIKVVYSGLGADEMYGGYTLMKNYKFLKRFSNAFNVIEDKFTFLNSFLIKKIDFLEPILNKNRLKLLKLIINNNSKNFISDLVTWDLEVQKNYVNCSVDIENYSDLVDFYFNYFLSSSHLPIADSISMSHSLELRVPFLSRRIYDSVYPDLKKTCGLKKFLLKRLENKYDKKFLNRKKSGLGVSTLNLNDEVIIFLIDNLFDKYIDSRYKITKDSLYINLKNKNLVRFPYMLFSLLTYDKAIR